MTKALGGRLWLVAGMLLASGCAGRPGATSAGGPPAGSPAQGQQHAADMARYYQQHPPGRPPGPPGLPPGVPR